MTRLFELTAQFKALQTLEDSDELPPEVIADTLEALEGDFAAKSEAVAKFILSLEASSASIAAAAQKMAARATRLQKRADSVRQYLLLQFQILDKKKIETDEVVIARRENPYAVVVSDETKVPEKYWVQPPAPPKRLDKEAIKEALKAKVDVQACYLDRGERVDIKI